MEMAQTAVVLKIVMQVDIMPLHRGIDRESEKVWWKEMERSDDSSGERLGVWK
jgi:hypothetical protein